MKKFNASDLSKKPSQVFAAAREGGAIIQHKDRQGKVVEEFVMIPCDTDSVVDGVRYVSYGGTDCNKIRGKL
jgi:hypothetical protein